VSGISSSSNPLTRICNTAIYHLQSFIDYVSPYMAKMGLPTLSNPRVNYWCNQFQTHFADYTFVKFVADIVNAMLIITLFPLILTVAILRYFRCKFHDFGSYMSETAGNFASLIYKKFESFSSTSSQVIKWLGTTCEELLSGELTWKQVWNDSLDCVENQLRKTVFYFGRHSMVAWLIRVSRIGDILQKLHIADVNAHGKVE